jgi:hypothetical protein
MDVAGFSKMASPPFLSTSDNKMRDLAWMAALSSTASCCNGELDGRPSMNSVFGLGPGQEGVKLPGCVCCNMEQLMLPQSSLKLPKGALIRK